MENENTKEDYLSNLILDELVEAKYWEQYIPNYMTNRNDIRSWFGVGTTSVSLLAILLPKIFASISWLSINVIAYIGFGLVIVSQITLQIFPKISCSDEDLKNMSELRSIYLEYYFKIERLYIDYLGGKYDNDFDVLEDEFYNIRKSIISIQYKKNLLHFKKIKKTNEKTIKNVRTELKAKFNIEL